MLFVDLVDSTLMVGAADPEVVRRRQTQFFESAARCVTTHGGIVEKFAGDAVMAAFGVPQAHEDDAERAVRAALAILESTQELGLEARAGVEAGEVVFDERDSTFATGEAVNLAARLQQAAEPNQLLLGPGAFRLTLGRVEVEDAGPIALRGREALWSWRALSPAANGGRTRSRVGPLVGREAELELLHNTYRRTVRDGRQHLFTIYGEPGIGKSRLAHEFVDTLDRATVLTGRALPYGEGVTYWPLAEMVKQAAGIADDDSLEEATRKLREACESDEVADLIALASGLLAAAGERSRQEILWAARRWAEGMAEAQPAVLVFEDVHWAEEPLLELIEHLVESSRRVPLLVLCLTRPDLLETRTVWGGGRVRSTAIELEPLAHDESERLVEELLADVDLPHEHVAAIVEKTGGNPLFVEETVRSLAEDGGEGIPDTVQAVVAARIDRLPPDCKSVLQRAAVIGRTFWAGAVAHLAPDVDDLEAALEGLALREFVTPEERSTIGGEKAYRFKHVLIREVAHGGLAKSLRADLHARFAAWLAERSGDELLEIRAHHLDRAAALLAELDGDAPEELKREAAAALEAAGRRAVARDANAPARKLFQRAVALEPTLARRYAAARAALAIGELPDVAPEMERVRQEAHDAGDAATEGRALTLLGVIALQRDSDATKARELMDEALRLLPDDDIEARFEALGVLTMATWYPGDVEKAERYSREALELARRAGRPDHEAFALQSLRWFYTLRLELDRADELLERELELAEQIGTPLARARAHNGVAAQARVRGDLDTAEREFVEARRLYLEADSVDSAAWMSTWLGWVLWAKGDVAGAEHSLREALRAFTRLEETARLCEAQRALAELLAETGRLDEAEELALAARRTVGATDLTSVGTTTMALGLVRAAQGRDAEAEQLLREAVDVYAGTHFMVLAVETATALAQFLRERGRDDEADEIDGAVPAFGAWLGRADVRRRVRV